MGGERTNELENELKPIWHSHVNVSRPRCFIFFVVFCNDASKVHMTVMTIPENFSDGTSMATASQVD